MFLAEKEIFWETRLYRGNVSPAWRLSKVVRASSRRAIEAAKSGGEERRRESGTEERQTDGLHCSDEPDKDDAVIERVLAYPVDKADGGQVQRDTAAETCAPRRPRLFRPRAAVPPR